MTNQYKINDISELENPLLVAGIELWEGCEDVPGFHIAHRIPGWYTRSVDPADYELVPNTFVNGKGVYVRK